MFEPLVRPHDATKSWTVEDLEQLPDDGMRYEILEGSLLVSPLPRNRHGRVIGRIFKLLESHARDGVYVGAFGTGVNIRGGTTYFVPDVMVMREEGTDNDQLGVDSSDTLLVVEVLSPGNARNDLVLKRREYASEQIPSYWIVDPDKQTLTVLEYAGGEHYREIGTFVPGERYITDTPFRIEVDPAELF
jgi:Uma2 family endonuclease